MSDPEEIDPEVIPKSVEELLQEILDVLNQIETNTAGV